MNAGPRLPRGPRRALPGLLRNPGRDWIILFLAIEYLARLDTSPNPDSRWTTLAAMAEDHSFRTDNYYGYSVDWARMPDGHYYSNKAPGPALLAFPLFAYLDRQLTAGSSNRGERDARRVASKNEILFEISFFTEAVPYAIVTLLVLGALQALSLPVFSLHVTAVALLFGNGASLFMNTFFGHGISAMLVLAMLLALHRRRLFLVGLFFGLACLCDYAATLLGLPLTLVLVRERWKRAPWLTLSKMGWLVAGGVGPAVAWAAYHTICFGGPLTLPNRYQNPAFVDVAEKTHDLWGIFQLLPDPDALRALLFSDDRGIAFTQGWVLVCLLAAVPVFWARRRTAPPGPQLRFGRRLTVFGLPSFLLVLWMNASFNGWHGGATPGPRYLSVVLPPCAVMLGAIYGRLPAFLRHGVLVLLLLSVVLFVLVHSTHQLAPHSALFPFYLGLLAADDAGAHLSRALYMSVGFLWAGLRAWRGTAGCAAARDRAGAVLGQ